ncbi:hypothetical protein XA68_17118 [Ophiocordyceps unilateralis]|uniref:Up-regulated in Daf-2 domain-containing protein n=1 Tax=Ophiocordyceps unilateralis TaxID=268505 RepID=A0A2A9P3R3_OPHUN|nr:hypothetical protein XA68_17118 [Ophiocordyceps unilateralis]
MRLSNALHLFTALATAAPILDRRWTGTTHRTSPVTIINKSGTSLSSISLVHKYSNIYKERHEWAYLAPGEKAADYMTVSYHTGPLTTGRDWWLLTFYTDQGRILYTTSPYNFRAAIDALESVASTLALAAAGAGAGLAGFSGLGGFLAPLAAVALAKLTTDQMYNSESTAGMKQHILRAEDEMGIMHVVVNPDFTVHFLSRSGLSTTGTVRGEVPRGLRIRGGEERP